MRIAVLLALTACGVSWARTKSLTPADAFERLKSLAGEWQASLPG